MAEVAVLLTLCILFATDRNIMPNRIAPAITDATTNKMYRRRAS
jgi:hypothetical protein